MSINTVSSSSSSSSSSVPNEHGATPSNRITTVVCSVIADAVDNALTNSLSSELASRIIEYIPVEVNYAGYDTPLYLSYPSICDAIQPWGEVQAIMQRDRGKRHIFVVKFNQQLPPQLPTATPPIDCDHGHGNDTHFEMGPFSIHKIGLDSSTFGRYILSQNMIAFDITSLQIDHFDAERAKEFLPYAIYSSDPISPSEMSAPGFIPAVAEPPKNENAGILFRWIRDAGLSILRNGAGPAVGLSSREYSSEQIVKNYSQEGWEVVNPNSPPATVS